MQQKFTQASDFRQERDFGQKISATFEFLGAHWRALGKCLAYYVLPATLLTGLAVGILQTQTNWGNLTEDIRYGNSISSSGSLWLSLLAQLITHALLGATLYGYVRTRMELPENQVVTPALVGQQIRQAAPRLLALSLLMTLIVIFGFFLLAIPGFYLGVALSLAWPVLVFEEAGLGQSMRRSIHLTGGHWWATLGLILVVFILISLLGIVFQIPQYAAMIGRVLHWSFLTSDPVLISAGVLSSIGQTLLYIPLELALAFQYFNLVEKKEGLGLRQLIDRLGSAPAPTAQNAAFRPDDDGEY
ncbi:hypothetical protein HNQ93_000126 [Hymenobacter luteus]|uniref:Glycerophosphoryl diester phosphodiesterase membrane domain-containing protein n=2 Tax=Hymenobacter TaxID=89966 RepID=A0A7W9SX25_9BACT|nr:MULTISPECIES: YciC family protein [Hymenobacter]MBB4600394.1 hypothetical protein [Hymenobacter latericoloratus]MBB6057296.1 hypothetical protein [Hymenobacter luteus]